MEKLNKYKFRKNQATVIMTNYSPLSENLIDWLNAIYPDMLLINGDEEKLDEDELIALQPAILISDPGYFGKAEKKLVRFIRANLPDTKIIFLTFYKSINYENIMRKAGIKGLVVAWHDYKQLPILLRSIFKKTKVKPRI